MIVRSLFSWTKAEIDQAFPQATLKVRGKGMKLLVAPRSQGQTHGKLLVVIPGKSGKAHDRNRFRRRARNIFYHEELYKKPLAWILLVYSQGLTLDFDEIKQFLVHNISA